MTVSRHSWLLQTALASADAVDTEHRWTPMNILRLTNGHGP
jgi:hypothetical protein